VSSNGEKAASALTRRHSVHFGKYHSRNTAIRGQRLDKTVYNTYNRIHFFLQLSSTVRVFNEDSEQVIL